jgi:hypothetical protein
MREPASVGEPAYGADSARDLVQKSDPRRAEARRGPPVTPSSLTRSLTQGLNSS